jgi:hypothetical protein
MAVRPQKFAVDVPRRHHAEKPRLESLHEEHERSDQDRHHEHEDHAHLLTET